MTRKSRLLLIVASAVVGLLALMSAIFYAGRSFSRVSMVLVFVAMAFVVFSQVATLRSERRRSER